MMSASAPLPVSKLPGALIEGLFTDLDDTLTTDGQLSVEAFSAVSALAAAGIRVVPVTGRSAGWCDLIVRLWPVAAVIGETGAFCMIREGGRTRTLMMQDEQARRDTASHRDRIARRVLEEVPDAELAGDQAFRLVDLAIDIAEAIPRLPQARIDRIVAILREEGMQAQASSIHVNGWFGQFDKGDTALRLLTEHWGLARDAAVRRWACVGDAPNDATLFAAFEHSIGVANVDRHLASISCPPRYITERAHGSGFAELADHLIRSRAG
jgi:HAD superfamily hydrolase (TIGR01484 family)